jgi:hypothetical protein
MFRVIYNNSLKFLFYCFIMKMDKSFEQLLGATYYPWKLIYIFLKIYLYIICIYTYI